MTPVGSLGAPTVSAGSWAALAGGIAALAFPGLTGLAIGMSALTCSASLPRVALAATRRPRPVGYLRATGALVGLAAGCAATELAPGVIGRLLSPLLGLGAFGLARWHDTLAEALR